MRKTRFNADSNTSQHAEKRMIESKSNLMIFSNRSAPKVSLLGVDSLWGDCTFIPADWSS